mmetsp:Transcript_38766/g.120330  ORF Transcript_38766/g.120330 Transcript_38766/m.120330 type:complete len:487 (+) Transcript_38766:431-1891(+)
MARCEGSHVVDDVGVGALVREGEVQPLREEPAVQGDAAVAPRDGAHLLLQVGRQVPRRVHGGRGHVAQQAQELLGGGGGRLDHALELVHQVLAIIQAADGVVGRGGDAIRGTHHVVGDAHPGAARRRLVQSADLPEVLQGLRELVGGRVRLRVEGRQGHPAGAGRVQLHELPAHLPALRVLPLAVGLRHALDDLRRRCEGVARGQEGVRAVPPREDKVLRRVLLEVHEGGPGAAGHRNLPLELLVPPDVPQVAWHARLEEQQVGLQDLVQVLLVYTSGRGEAVERVRGLQHRQGLVEDQALQGGDHGHGVAEREPVAGLPGLQQRLHEHRRPVLEDADLMNLRDVLLHAVGLQAADEPAVLLAEVAVHEVAHGPRRQAAHVVLRQGLEGGPDAGLDRGQPPRRAGVPAVEHGLQGRAEAGLHALHGHGAAGAVGAAAEAAPSGCGSRREQKAQGKDGHNVRGNAGLHHARHGFNWAVRTACEGGAF